MQLRQYQTDIIEKARHALAEHGSAVLQMPTGAGKTKTATAIVADYEGVVWFVCHRREIERQVMAAFTEAGIDFGLVSPRGKPDYSKRVQIISVATLAKRVGELPAPALVIWDECHHVAAKSWAAIRDALDGAKHLGLTATPERLDGKGLRDWFAELIVGPTIMDLIAGGHLSPFRYFAPSDPDLTAAKMQAGDYRKDDAAKIMNTPVLIGDALREYRDKAGGKRALAFCASVEASQALVARFNEEGIPAAHIDGTTPDDVRTGAVADLSAGRIKLLSNVEVFTEGVDIPAIDAVILLRPTRSVTLMLQMIGRALRVADGKDEAVILDHAGLWQERGLISDPWHWSLDGGAAAARRMAGERGPRKCPECKEVRGERVEVCACGYEFPTGREIGEYDGVLREVTSKYSDSIVSDGCETQTSFAVRVGKSHKEINYLVRKRGMPNIGGNPVVEEAIKWINLNLHEDCDLCTLGSLARLSCRDYSFVKKRADAGLLPMVGKKFKKRDSVAILDALPRRSPPLGCESIHSVAKKLGLSFATVKKALAIGEFPNVDGYPVSSAAATWFEKNIKKAPKGSETQNAFAKRMNVANSTVRRWIENGMPSADGIVIINPAIEWVYKNIDIARLGINKKRIFPPGNERAADFARRVGVSWPTPKNWSKFGLPYDPKKGIPIQAALEWIRDNRPDIVIPPEAWPSANEAANDNTTTAKEDAA